MTNSKEDDQTKQRMSIQDYIEYQAGFVIRDEARVIADKFKKGEKKIQVFDQQITFKNSRRILLIEELRELGYRCYYTHILSQHSNKSYCWCLKIKNYHTLPESQWYIHLESRIESQ